MKRFLSLFGYHEGLAYKVRLTYYFNVFSFLVILNFLIFYLIFFPIPNILLLTGAILLLLIVNLFILKASRYTTGKTIILFSAFSLLTAMSLRIFPDETGLNYYYFIIAPFSFFLFDLKHKRERRILYGINCLAVILLVHTEITGNSSPLIPLDSLFLKITKGMNVLTTIGIITVVFYLYSRNLASTHRELNNMANSDELTGCFNRRALFRLGEDLLKSGRAKEENFALLILDIDNFKQINDTYGHLVGDQVLQHLVKVLYANIRKDDILGRFGGEEFIVILSSINSQFVLPVSEKLRESVEAHSIEFNEHQTINPTVSIGAVLSTFEYKSLEAIIQKADEALYEAKTSGKNKVCYR